MYVLVVKMSIWKMRSILSHCKMVINPTRCKIFLNASQNEYIDFTDFWVDSVYTQYDLHWCYFSINLCCLVFSYTLIFNRWCSFLDVTSRNGREIGPIVLYLKMRMHTSKWLYCRSELPTIYGTAMQNHFEDVHCSFKSKLIVGHCACYLQRKNVLLRSNFLSLAISWIEVTPRGNWLDWYQRELLGTLISVCLQSEKWIYRILE